MVGNLLKNKIIILMIEIIILFLLDSCSTIGVNEDYHYNDSYSMERKKRKINFRHLSKIIVIPNTALLKEGASMILKCYGKDTKGRKMLVYPQWIVETPEVGYVSPKVGRRVIFYSQSKGVAFIKVRKGKVVTTVIIEVK